MSARSLVQPQSPPSTYAIAAWVDKQPGAGGKVVGLTLERAFFIGTGLFLAGFRGANLLKGALAASATVTGWIWADYSLRLQGKTGLTPWSQPTAGPVTAPEGEALVQQWLDTVCKGDPAAVTAMYHHDGILVGTLAKTLKRGRAAIRPYFDMFLAKKGLCGKILSEKTQRVNGNLISSGIYEFAWTENGTPKSVKARFSFAFKHTPQGWQILHHHSSAMP